LGRKDRIRRLLLLLAVVSPALALADFSLHVLHSYNLDAMPWDELVLRIIPVAFLFGFSKRYAENVFVNRRGQRLIDAKGRAYPWRERYETLFSAVQMCLVMIFSTSIVVGTLLLTSTFGSYRPYISLIIEYYRSLGLPAFIKIPLSLVGKSVWILTAGWALWVPLFYFAVNTCVAANEMWRIGVLFLVPLSIMYTGTIASDIVEGLMMRKGMRKWWMRQSFSLGVENNSRSTRPSPVRSGTAWQGSFNRLAQQLKTSGKGSGVLRGQKIMSGVPVPYGVFSVDDGAAARRIANRAGLVAVFKGRSEHRYGKYEFFALPRSLAKKLFDGQPVSPINKEEEEILRQLYLSGRLEMRKNRYRLVDHELKSDIARQLSIIEGEGLFYVV